MDEEYKYTVAAVSIFQKLIDGDIGNAGTSRETTHPDSVKSFEKVMGHLKNNERDPAMAVRESCEKIPYANLAIGASR